MKEVKFLKSLKDSAFLTRAGFCLLGWSSQEQGTAEYMKSILTSKGVVCKDVPSLYSYTRPTKGKNYM